MLFQNDFWYIIWSLGEYSSYIVLSIGNLIVLFFDHLWSVAYKDQTVAIAFCLCLQVKIVWPVQGVKSILSASLASVQCSKHHATGSDNKEWCERVFLVSVWRKKSHMGWKKVQIWLDGQKSWMESGRQKKIGLHQLAPPQNIGIQCFSIVLA